MATRKRKRRSLVGRRRMRAEGAVLDGVRIIDGRHRARAARDGAGLNVELGDRVCDKISGFTGIVTSYTVWLNGCRRVNIDSEKINKDGSIANSYTFDIDQLVVLKKRVHKAVTLMQLVATGGPRPGPAPRPVGASRR